MAWSTPASTGVALSKSSGTTISTESGVSASVGDVIVVALAFDNASTSAPSVSLSVPAGETATWEIRTQHVGLASTAGASSAAAVIKTTTAWSNHFLTATLSAAVVAKVLMYARFAGGDTATIRPSWQGANDSGGTVSVSQDGLNGTPAPALGDLVVAWCATEDNEFPNYYNPAWPSSIKFNIGQAATSGGNAQTNVGLTFQAFHRTADFETITASYGNIIDGTAGIFTVAGQPGGTGVFAGSGVLSLGRGPVAISGSVGLSGSGALSFSANVAASGARSLSGSGSLAFTGAKPGVARSVALSGSGTLVGKMIPNPGTYGSDLYGSGIYGKGNVFEGSAALSGSGSLTLAGKPHVARSVALSGSGALGLVGAPKPIQAVGLSGSGALGLVPVAGFARTGVLSGTGTLTRSWVATPIQTVQLSGAGSLTFVRGPIAVSQSGALSGSGTLSLARGPVGLRGTLGLSGAGSLTLVPVVVGFARTGALSGVGALTFVAVAGVARSATLSGSGTLALAGAPGPVQSVALSGAGTLAVTRGPVALSGSAAVSGAGTLTGVAALVAVVGSAALSGAGAVTTGSVVVGAQGAATLAGVGALTTALLRVTLAGAAALAGEGALTLTKWFLFTANASGGTATGTGWVTPENATGGDNSAYATWTTDISDAVSAPLIVSNFGTWSSIPAGSTIPKITVRVKGYVDHE